MELTVMETRDIQKKSKKKKGFTLIEMVVVIAIIAILAGIAIPQALKAVDKAKVTADIAAAKTIATAISTDIAEGETLKESEKEWEKITETTTANLAKNLEGGTIPISKKDKTYDFYYRYTKATNTLEIGAGPRDSSKEVPKILYPKPNKDY